MNTKTRKTFDLATAMQTVKVTESEAMTFSELMDGWCAAHDDPNDLLRARKWVAAFGTQSAWSITSVQLATAARAMHESGRYKNSSINRDVAAIGSAYKWAMGKGKAPAGFISPSLGVKRFDEPIRRVFIEDDKIKRLRDLALTYPDRRFPIFVHLLADTGARKGELLDRVWDEIDLEKREIILHDSKTGKPRVLHFTEATAKLILRLAPSRVKGSLVFPGRVPSEPKNFRASWASLCIDAGVPGLHMHDLRHDKARRLLVAGISLPIAASLMGHSAQILERRYGHLATTDLRKAAEAAWAMAA